MLKHYYLSNNGTHIGPFPRETVLSRLQGGQTQWTDYVYDESVGEWLTLLEHPEFSTQGTKTPVRAAPKSEIPDALKQKEWFILKDGSNYGPFAYVDIVKMLQEKSLFEYDYIWNERMSDWRPLAEVEEFCPDRIKQVKDSAEVEVAEIFFRRRHARARYGTSLIVHDHKTVFKGKTFEISAGGAGVIIDTNTLNPGQSLFLHFQPGDGVPPFNAVCQIVSKQHGGADAVRYGIKFVTLSQSVRDSIKNYTAKVA